MFFGMGGPNHGHGNTGCNICDGNTLWLYVLLNCFGCGVGKDDILNLLFLVMLLECLGCGTGCNK